MTRSSLDLTCRCGKVFHTIPSRVKDGRGKYCSQVCRIKYCPRRGLTSGRNIICEICGISFYAQTWQIINVRKYCSKVCLFISRKGKRNSPETEFKRTNGNGYRRLLYKGILPQECEECGFLGNIKRLHVHHKDHNRKNNSLSNFKVLCRPCHLLHHGRVERVYVEGRKAV